MRLFKRKPTPSELLIQDLITKTNTGELKWHTRYPRFWKADGYTFYYGSSGQMSIEWSTHQGPHGEHEISSLGVWPGRTLGMLSQLGNAINQQYLPKDTDR